MNVKQALDILIAVGICGLTSSESGLVCSDCPLYTDDDEESPIHCKSWTPKDVAEAIKLLKTVKVLEPNPADPEVIIPVDEAPNFLSFAPESAGTAHSLRFPKEIATIKICGAIAIHITEDTEGFTKPTPEQIKNLKEMLCIDVELLEEKEDD